MRRLTFTASGVLWCRCGHHAREHRRACRCCRGKAWACKFFVSDDAIPDDEIPAVPVLPTQIELFGRRAAA